MPEEFIEPTREGRRNFILLLSCILVMGAALHFFLAPWFLAFLKTLPLCDQLSWVQGSFLVILLLPVTLALFWAIPHARKLIIFQQSPLPNAWVLRRTPIKRGSKVWWLAFALLGWSAVVVIFSFWAWFKMSDIFASLASQQCRHNMRVEVHIRNFSNSIGSPSAGFPSICRVGQPFFMNSHFSGPCHVDASLSEKLPVSFFSPDNSVSHSVFGQLPTFRLELNDVVNDPEFTLTGHVEGHQDLRITLILKELDELVEA